MGQNPGDGNSENPGVKVNLTDEHRDQISAPLPRHQHELTDAAFLAEFDPELPAFADVATALSDGDLHKAKDALVKHFRERRSPRWVHDLRATTEPTDALFHLWPPRFVVNREDLLQRANLICANRFTITDGMVMDFGPQLDWVTPETRALIVPGNAFKCCHWLHDLARAWVVTRDSRYATKWSELIERWLQDFPMFLDGDFTGEEMIFNRHYGEKSMPTGQRLFCWLSCLYTGIPFAPEVAVETAFQFIKALWYNGAVYQHFEASPFLTHNHHIMRTVNVPACMALAFPETPRFVGLLALARDRMSRHVRESFLPDGGYTERSSSYAQITVCMFLAPLALARLNAVDLADEDTIARVRRAAELYASTVLPTGDLPPCGDGTATGPDCNAASLYLAALVCESGLAATVLHRTGLAALLPPALRPNPTATELPRHCRYPNWGIAVLRSDWGTDASALAINIPDGENPNRSHSHDDSLSCSLVVRGRQIIAVPANELYLYVHAAEWTGTSHHAYLYSSLSKNVVLPFGRPRLDPNQDQADWGTGTPAAQSCLRETGEGAELRARTGVSGVDWERHVTLTGEGWTIRDRLIRAVTAETEVPHILQWLFHYGVNVARTDDGALAEDGHVRVRLTIVADTPWKATLTRNADWLKPNGGRAGEAAPWLLRIHFGAGAADATITTSFTPEP